MILKRSIFHSTIFVKYISIHASCFIYRHSCTRTHTHTHTHIWNIIWKKE